MPYSFSTYPMIFTGLTDEAGADLANQISTARELGWTHLELRGVSVDGAPACNVHDLPEPAFDRLRGQLADSGVAVHCFASAIANWATRIDEPFDRTLAEVGRAIPRMQALGARHVRIMSFAVKPGEDINLEERIRRLREIVVRFRDAGLAPLHENCMNYGGLGAGHTMRLLDAVPGLRLIFDPGNTVCTDDHDKPEPRPKQSAWDFYRQVRDHVDYLHVKDAVQGERGGKPARIHVWPGDGEGDVRRILTDVLAQGRVHTISIEPHIAGDPEGTGLDGAALARHNFIAYGRRLQALVAECGGVR